MANCILVKRHLRSLDLELMVSAKTWGQHEDFIMDCAYQAGVGPSIVLYDDYGKSKDFLLFEVYCAEEDLPGKEQGRRLDLFLNLVSRKITLEVA